MESTGQGEGLQQEEGSNMFRTMLIEDNLGMRQVVKNSLESQFPFMDIIEASDGVEAFQKIDFDPPHLIFMDIGLPGENGLELTRRIKSKYPDITIIILSSYDSPEYRETAMRVKANFFLTKGSSTPDDVCRLVEAILLGEGFSADGSAPQH
jgi:DNA-binding NarL/FixJ family response regulator